MKCSLILNVWLISFIVCECAAIPDKVILAVDGLYDVVQDVWSTAFIYSGCLNTLLTIIRL